MPKDDMAVASSATDDGSIVAPGETHDGSTLWLVEGVGPSGSITKSEHLKRSNSEVVTVWSPLDAGDHMIIRG